MTELQLDTAAAAEPNLPEFTVSELAFALKRVVENSFAYVRVRGEISGFKRAASGHSYLTLKDDKACLDAVLWRNSAVRLRHALQDGLEVVCTGRLSTYPGRSKYQLIIEQIAPAGVGALMALLEERRRKLAAEGLFDEARKRPLPFLPEVIGVVTSPTGAVIRDILHRLTDRFPRRVLLWPVLVQGDSAAEQVAAAIAGFNRLPSDGAVPRPDLIIVARGGGSIEDLWAFNEEIVVRAAAASEIPLISAVGHETDTTLIDFAADRRAPTPTAAAEMAVPVRAELLSQVADLDRRQAAAVLRHLDESARAVQGLARGLRGPMDLLTIAAQRLDDGAERLRLGLGNLVGRRQGELDRAAAALRPTLLQHRLERQDERLRHFLTRLMQIGRRRIDDADRDLKAFGKLLESLSYKRVLKRGYSVVKARGGKPLTSAAAATPGLPLTVEFHDGEAAATVDSAAAPARPGKADGHVPRRPPVKSQGTLF